MPPAPCNSASVQRESAEPPPIPFPRKRALPGFAAAALVFRFSLVAGFATLRHGTPTGALSLTLSSGMALVVRTGQELRAGWIVVGLAASLASLRLPALLALRKTDF